MMQDQTNVSSLADELLLEIFEEIRSLYMKEALELFIQGGQPWRYGEVVRRLDEKKWVPLVTHVCHRWREIALAAPKLWRDIHIKCHDFSWPREMLKRTKTLPFTARVGRYAADDNRQSRFVVAFMQENMARCSGLTICSMDQASIGRILTKDGDYANLKSLLVASHESLSPGNEFSLADFSFAQLRKLALYRVELASSARFLENLTHVYLHSVPKLTAPWLLNLLSKTPLLEVLDANHVHDPHSADSDDVSHLTSPVTLKSLRLFSLDTDLEAIPIILPNVILPETAKREISFFHGFFDEEDEQPEDFTGIFGPLREKLTPRRAPGDQSKNGNDILSLRLVSEDHRRLCGMFHAFTNAFTPIEMLDNQPWAILRLDQLESTMFDSITVPFFNLLSLQNLVTLQIIAFPLDPVQWGRLFADLPALETVFVLKDFEGFVMAAEFGTYRSPMGFPALKRLMFGSADWHADLSPEVREHFTNLILRRKERGVPIEEMAFSDDNGSSIFEDYVYGLPSFGVKITILPKLDTDQAIFCRLSNEFDEVEADFYEIEQAQNIYWNARAWEGRYWDSDSD